MTLAAFYNRLFVDVDDDTVAQLERASVVRALEPHSYLFDQYSEARGVYVLENGVIMIERSSAAGRRQILGYLFYGRLHFNQRIFLEILTAQNLGFNFKSRSHLVPLERAPDL